VKRNVIDLGFSFEPITAPVEAGDLSLTVLGSFGAKNSANHKFLLFARFLVALLFEPFEVGGYVGMVEPG
jgi:hypothetical protein